MLPKYNLDKIKFATDEATFLRAVVPYESGKITEFKEVLDGYSAVVLGTKPYNVFVSARNYGHGSCNCYLGEQDTLCKHMVAVSIRAVTGGRKLSKEDKLLKNKPTCSGRLGTLSREKLITVKKSLTGSIRYVKPYRGPSRIWFAYQDSLSEGCNRLSAIVTDLPVSKQTARLLVELLLQLDKKLTHGGVDDSDGTVGGFIEETVDVLKEYVKLEPSCVRVFHVLENKETSFGWEEPLIEFIK